MELSGCRAEIDLKRLTANCTVAKEKFGKNLIAVVKANAYGHGVTEIVKRLVREGIGSFAVATPREALEVRGLAENAEIIVLGYVAQCDAPTLYDNSITLTVYDERSLSLAKTYGLCAYVKYDTGMGRLGFTDVADAERAVKNCKKIKGVFSHLAVSDSVRGEDIEYTERQVKRLECLRERLCGDVEDARFYMAASAGAERYAGRFDGVRIGAALYGIPPSAETVSNCFLPIMTLKTVVSQVKHLKPDSFVSYGRTYSTIKGGNIAVIAAGYAEGISRALSGKGYVTIGGKRCKIIGNVTMNQTVIDVSDIQVAVGDEVVIFGDNPTAQEVAEMINSISYEIVCGVCDRIPRIYI